jgi:hypothetical protein
MKLRGRESSEKLIVIHLIKKTPGFYVTRKVNYHVHLSLVKWPSTHPISLWSNLMFFSYLCPQVPSMPLAFLFSLQKFAFVSHLSHACCMPHSSHNKMSVGKSEQKGTLDDLGEDHRHHWQNSPFWAIASLRRFCKTCRLFLPELDHPVFTSLDFATV